MGVWGHGPFENDAALDWSMDLAGSAEPLEDLERSLEDAQGPGRLEQEEADTALAAAAFVAAALNRDLSDLPDELLHWAASLDAAFLKALLPLARKALERVAGPDSEVRELWEEAGDFEHGAWLKALRGLDLRLRKAEET